MFNKKEPEMKIYNIDKFFKIAVLVAKRNHFYDNYQSIVTPRIVCKDGFTVSVQAGSAMYSTPREDELEAYEEYELGWPTKREKLLDDYAEAWYEDGPKDYTKIIYAYVPKDVVNKVIRKHGGIVDVEYKFRKE